MTQDICLVQRKLRYLVGDVRSGLPEQRDPAKLQPRRHDKHMSRLFEICIKYVRYGKIC